MATTKKGTTAAAPKAAPKATGRRTAAKKATPKATPKGTAAKGSTAAPSAKLSINKAAVAKVNFRGARAAWLEEICKWDGKPVAEFTAAMAKEPPTKPKTGKYAATGEPPMGWVRFFVRQQLVTIK